MLQSSLSLALMMDAFVPDLAPLVALAFLGAGFLLVVTVVSAGIAFAARRVRLGIVSALAASESLTFAELHRLLDATDGNLSVHARRLEEAGYVACSKTFEDRVPRTEYRLTAEGRRAFERYLAHLEAVIEHARRRRF